MQRDRSDVSEYAATRHARNAGLAVLVTGLLFISVAPWHVGPMPHGMWSPVTAFELLRTPDEVERLFGPADSGQREAIVASMQRCNTLDYLFMLAYGAFMVAFAASLRAAGDAWARVGMALGVLAVVADALENACLLAIASALGGDYETPLRALRYFTWVKWFAIAFGCATWIPGLRRRGLWGRSIGAFAALSVLATSAAFVYRGVFAEAMALTIQLCWLTALVLTVHQTRVSRAHSAKVV